MLKLSLPAGLTVFSVIIAAGGSMHSLPASAQTVEECMSASGTSAVAVCQAAISAGNHTAPVYFQLASKLHYSKQSEQALSVIAQGLSRFKNDKRLKELKERVETDIVERRALAKAGDRNTNATSNAEMKIACLTTNDESGLSACVEYLAQTDKDGDKIRSRRDKLQASLSLKEPEPVDELPEPDEPVITPDEPVIPTVIASTSVDNERTRARRTLVRDTQQSLKDLGLNPGVADGKPGPKTRYAVSAFRQQLGIPAKDTIDNRLLIDLQAEVRALKKAQETLYQSRQAKAEKDTQNALILLDKAESKSRFLRTPPGYRKDIELTIAANQSRLQLANTQQSSTTQVATATEAAPSELSQNEGAFASTATPEAQQTTEPQKFQQPAAIPSLSRKTITPSASEVAVQTAVEPEPPEPKPAVLNDISSTTSVVAQQQSDSQKQTTTTLARATITSSASATDDAVPSALPTATKSKLVQLFAQIKRQKTRLLVRQDNHSRQISKLRTRVEKTLLDQIN